MKRDREKTKEQLVNELAEMRRRINELEALENEHEQVKSELEKAQKRLRTIFESVSDGVAVTDTELNITDINEAGLRMFGYDHKEEFIGRSGLEFISPKEHDRAILDMQNTLEKGYIGRLEYTFLNKKGMEFLAEYNVMAIKDESGSPAGFVATMKDTTERNKAENELRKSEEKYRILHDTMAQGVVFQEKTGKVISMNPAAESILGVALEKIADIETINRNLRTIHEDGSEYKAEHHPTMVSLRTGEPVKDAIMGIYHPEEDGYRWVLINTIPLYQHGEDKPYQVFVTFTDITERKRAEEKLIQSEDKFIELFNNIGSCVAVYEAVDNGKNFVFVDFNSAAEEADRIGKEEVIGRRVDEVFPGVIEFGLLDVFRRVWQTGKAEHYPISQYRDRRITGWRENYVYKLTGGEVVAVYEDVTERKQAEEALRESEEKLRLMYESVTEGIIITDLNGIIIDTNEAAMRMNGCDSKNQLIGRSAFEFIAERDHARAKENLKETLERGRSRIIEYTLLREDGSEFPGELSAALLKDTAGNPTGFVAIIRDITERKYQEEERLKTERLESVGTLASGIAHDFNNLLTGIIGNIDLARRYIGSKGEALESLNEAEKASLRARDLTQQLLTFSRGGAPVKRLLNISPLIRESTTFALRGSKTRSELSIPEDLWAVEADEGQIIQVIHNMVKNADEAMPKGGVVNISARNVVVQDKEALSLSKGRYVLITVADQGVGIKKEHLSKIFEPYFTTKQRGSGLGLTTAYSIIKNHGGYITVESEQNVGTTVLIYLPASRKQVPRSEPKEVQPAFLGQGRILVMDDEEVVRELLYGILTRAGYEVELTKDGTEAVGKFREAKESGQPFDAVILDLTVPGAMGGKEAIIEILEMEPEIKAIVSSGYANDTIMSEYREYGFSAVVPKPYTVGEIERILHDLLNS